MWNAWHILPMPVFPFSIYCVSLHPETSEECELTSVHLSGHTARAQWLPLLAPRQTDASKTHTEMISQLQEVTKLKSFWEEKKKKISHFFQAGVKSWYQNKKKRLDTLGNLLQWKVLIMRRFSYRCRSALIRFLLWLAAWLKSGEVSGENGSWMWQRARWQRRAQRHRETDLAMFFTDVLHFSTHLQHACVCMCVLV